MKSGELSASSAPTSPQRVSREGGSLREKSVKTRIASIALLALLCVSPHAQTPSLAQDLRDRIDAAATQVLAAIGVPSASVAIVRDGELAYAQAYGDASISPRTPARPEMRYSYWPSRASFRSMTRSCASCLR
jgi:hypothetical protein